MVTLWQALEVGVTRRQVRAALARGTWRRADQAVYLVRGGFDDTPARRRRAAIRAAVLSLGPGAVAVYETAAELHGIAGLRASKEIHISVPAVLAKRRIDSALRVHQLCLPPGTVGSVAGIAATVPLRTVADLLCRVDRFAAVAVLDSALNSGLVQAAELAAIPAMIRRRRGAVAARSFLAEADGRAQSPLETRVRLRCVDGGVPRTISNTRFSTPTGTCSLSLMPLGRVVG